MTQATSLFDYAAGQTTATFTNLNFPLNQLTLANLPPALVAQAAQMVAAAGITDPNIAAGAELDYIATNDASFISSDAAAGGATTTAATIIQSTQTPPTVGITQSVFSIVEPSTGSLPVTFDLYLTSASTSNIVVDYAVVALDSTDLPATAFGGSFPTGEATIAAGPTVASFTVSLPAGALGTQPSQTLALQIRTPNGELILAPIAETTIINNQPEPGSVAEPVIATLADIGTFSQSGPDYTLDLGTLTQGQDVSVLQFAIENAATAPADNLGGSFTATGDAAFIVTGDGPLTPLAAGQIYDSLYASIDTSQTGTYNETITFTPTDSNSSGYETVLPALTLTIGADVTAGDSAPCYCPGTHILTDRGEVVVEALAMGDRLVTYDGTLEPIVWIGRRSYAGRFLTRSPQVWPVRFAAGSLGDGLPRRDLLVSPQHAMFLDDLLVPAEQLVNGVTITRERGCERVEYIHLELAAHGVIWAEGAPSGTYLDDDNRRMFHNWADTTRPSSTMLCRPRVRTH